MRSLRLMPWKTHAALSIAGLLIPLVPSYLIFGFGPGWYSRPSLISYGWLIFAWLVTAPLIRIEVAAAIRERPDVDAARTCAGVAHVVLAFVGMLPVTLHLLLATSTAEPMDIGLVRVALNSYGLLLAVYFMATCVAVLMGSRIAANSIA